MNQVAIRSEWFRGGPFSRLLVALLLLVGPRASSVGVFAEEVLIPVGTEWVFFKGTVEPDPTWAELDFDDSGPEWLEGITGIGYADGDDATVLTDMRNSYWSIYCRTQFTVDDPDAITRLVLRIDYDDGFVAYINGFEVARSNLGVKGTPPPFNAPAGGNHEAGTVEVFDIADHGLVLNEGANVLAVQVHNTTLASSDLSFIPELVVDPDVCPIDLNCAFDQASRQVSLSWTSRTTYEAIELSRDGELIEAFIDGAATTYTDLNPPAEGAITYELVGIVDGDACDPPLDCTVIIPSAEDVLIAPGDDWSFFRGRTALPLDWNVPEFDDGDWEVGPTGIGYGDNDDATVLSDMQNGYLTVFCRKVFEVNPDGLKNLQLTVVVDDGMVVFFNGEEIARHNMPAGVPTNTTSASAAGEPTPITIDIPLDAVVNGENLLAISVHNANLTSSDLSFIPTLVKQGGGQVLRDLFRRGDANNDISVNLGDAIFILNHLFRSGATPVCVDAADVNDDGGMGIADPIYLLNHLFRSGQAPPPPGTSCGPDTTEDAMGVCSTFGC